MERDMDILRGLALSLADPGAPCGNFTGEEVEYHSTLLVEAGLAKGLPTREGVYLGRLTWQGQEFADLARDEQRWLEVRQRVETIGGASFEVWLRLLRRLAECDLGLHFEEGSPRGD